MCKDPICYIFIVRMADSPDALFMHDIYPMFLVLLPGDP